MPPMEEQQKEIQYPGWHKDTTGKELWSGENDEVSHHFSFYQKFHKFLIKTKFMKFLSSFKAISWFNDVV